MAEIVGTVASVITLVGLLKGCIDACELIRAAKDYKQELEKYDLKLALEQCRLKTWGKSMGLIREEEAQEERHLLENFEFRHVVQKALQQIINLLTDSDRLSKKYGAQETSMRAAIEPNPDSWRSASTLKLVMAFKRLRIRDTIRSQTDKAVMSSIWVFHDQKKYASLIDELRTLVDAVEHVTRHLVTKEQQQQLFISHINAISDVKTLNMLTEVCEVDHPAISDAASVRAEILSFTTTRKEDVSDWIHHTTETLNELHKQVTDEMESWDLTDFRRHYLALLNSQAMRSSIESSQGAFSPEYDSDEDDKNDRNDTTIKKNSREASSTGISTEDDFTQEGLMKFNGVLASVTSVKKTFLQLRYIHRILSVLSVFPYPSENMSSQIVLGMLNILFRMHMDLMEDIRLSLPGIACQVGGGAQLSRKKQTEEKARSIAIRGLKMTALAATALESNEQDVSIPKDLKNPNNSQWSPNHNDALRYLDLVRGHYAEAPNVYNEFLEIMSDFRDEALDIPGVVNRVKILFAGQQTLIKEFESFLPPWYITRDDTVNIIPMFRKAEALPVSSLPENGVAAVAVNTTVPDIAPLLDITLGLDMTDLETLRYYTELSIFRYGTHRETLAFSPRLSTESRQLVADIAGRFGLRHEDISLENDAVQLIVRRARQHPESNDSRDSIGFIEEEEDDDGDVGT